MMVACVSASACAGMWTPLYQQRLKAASHQNTSWLAGSHKVMNPLHQDAFATQSLSSLIFTSFCTWLRLNPTAACSLSISTKAQCHALCQCCNALCRRCHGATGTALRAQACRDCCSERIPPTEAVPAAHSSRKHGHTRADVPWRCRPNREWPCLPAP